MVFAGGQIKKIVIITSCNEKKKSTFFRPTNKQNLKTERNMTDWAASEENTMEK